MDLKVNLYDEDPIVIVARYAILKFVEKKYPGDGWVCGNAMDKCVERATKKIRRVFTEQAIELMAYHISGNSDYTDKMLESSQLSKSDLNQLLECACSLEYPVYGIYAKARKKYLNNQQENRMY